MDNDFTENPDAPFEIDKKIEEEIKLLFFEMGVRNFIASFDPDCLKLETEEERIEKKDELLSELMNEYLDYDFCREVPHDIYNMDKVTDLFNENLKRNEDGNFAGTNQELMDIVSKITLEMYENECMKFVDEGLMELVYDEKIDKFLFRLVEKKENVINKSNKPRRGRKKK